MNLYEQQFIIAYKYYLKYGHEIHTPVEATKSLLGMNNIVIILDLSILLFTCIVRFVPTEYEKYFEGEFYLIFFFNSLFCMPKFLDRMTWKKLNFEKLINQKDEVKSRIWWLTIISWICMPISFGLSALIVVITK